MPDLISYGNALIRLRFSLFDTASFMLRPRAGIVTVADERTLALLRNDLQGKSYTTVCDQVQAKEVGKIFYLSLTHCWGDEREVSELALKVQPLRQKEGLD